MLSAIRQQTDTQTLSYTRCQAAGLRHQQSNGSSWKKGNKATDWTPAPEDYGALAYEDVVEAAKLGSTVIVGGYIKTGLVSASNINVGTLSADRIAAKTITGTKLADGTVGDLQIASGLSATKITTGTLDASKITVSNLSMGGRNIYPNSAPQKNRFSVFNLSCAICF